MYTCKQPPITSHQEACRFVAADLTAQLCLRIILWLEGLASEALDLEKKVRYFLMTIILYFVGILWCHVIDMEWSNLPLIYSLGAKYLLF